jgi:hypothetical protein
MIYTIFCLTLILLVWFKTEAFLEYSKKLHLDGVFKIKDWEVFKNTIDASTSYHTYLRLKYPIFIVKLITCPICLNMWLSIPSIFMYGIQNYSIIVILSLFMYYGMVKLMN